MAARFRRIRFGALLLVALAIYILFFSQAIPHCTIVKKQELIKGSSLTGIAASDETAEILYGYYDCNEIQRGEIVAYRYAGSADPLLKIVKGIPGDSFALQAAPNNLFYLLIGGELQRNSNGELYQLDANRAKLLSLYIQDNQGVIPADAYLILGNLASGTLDSSRFGLVAKTEIVGKANRFLKR